MGVGWLYQSDCRDQRSGPLAGSGAGVKACTGPAMSGRQFRNRKKPRAITKGISSATVVGQHCPKTSVFFRCTKFIAGRNSDDRSFCHCIEETMAVSHNIEDLEEILVSLCKLGIEKWN